MRNPCQTCDRSLLDKDECSIACERRHEYCKSLGISVTGGAGPAPRVQVQGIDAGAKPRSCSAVVAAHTPYKREVVGSMPTRTTNLLKVPEVPRVPKVSKPPKPPKHPKPPKPPYDWHAPRGMRSKGGRLEKATALMKEGKGNREVSRLTGMSKTTAAKLRKVLETENGGPFLCPCGKPATHPGWCSYRFAKSPRRQKFIVDWNDPGATRLQSLPP